MNWVDALAWQVQRRIVEANCLDRLRKGSQEGTVHNRLAITFRAHYTPAGMSTFEAKVGMSDLQAERGRNVFGALVVGGPMLSTDRSHAELWELSWDGSDAGHASHSVAQYRGIIWCWNCAAWTSRTLCKLSMPCSGVISTSARDALSRARRGYPPRGGVCWPLTATEELLEFALTAP